MDFSDNPLVKVDDGKNRPINGRRLPHQMAGNSSFELFLPAQPNAEAVRDCSHETFQSGSRSFAGATGIVLPENVQSSTDLRELPSASMHENARNVWSAIADRARAVFQTACGSDSDARGNMRLRWNATLRRVSIMDPMRCLQDRIVGCHWAPSTFSSAHSIWLLGVCYPLSITEGGGSCNTEVYRHFEADFQSLIWITYRKGFQVIMDSKLTTDVGWGCMIRSGQMLLAEGLIYHHLGRNWRRSASNSRVYVEILQCFGDNPSCSYSIHNIVKNGGPFGVLAGSWMGPYSICRSLEALMVSHKKSCVEGSLETATSMAVHVVGGNFEGERGGAPCICIDAVSELCDNWGSVTGDACALLLFIPLVLGMNRINSRYLQLLAETFKFPQSLGVLGGKPGASVYMVGVQGDQVIYLDPHHVQQMCLVSPDNPRADTSTYHCSNVKRMPMCAIDPSLALGFYCRNQEEFRDFCERASELEKKGERTPMFTVVASMKDESLVKDCQLNTNSEEGWQIL